MIDWHYSSHIVGNYKSIIKQQKYDLQTPVHHAIAIMQKIDVVRETTLQEISLIICLSLALI